MVKQQFLTQTETASAVVFSIKNKIFYRDVAPLGLRDREYAPSTEMSPRWGLETGNMRFYRDVAPLGLREREYAPSGEGRDHEILLPAGA